MTAVLTELTRAEVAELASSAVLVLPFGAVEQHGPHLPYGTDLAVVDAVARRACDQAATEAPIVLAPPLPYGSSDHHLDVGGALSLAAETFAACARDVLRSAAATGFQRAFIVNGHGGNAQLLRAAAAGAAIVVAGGSYWQLAAPELAVRAVGGAPVPGHAGRFESSLALALGLPTKAPVARQRSAAVADGGRYWLEDPGRWRRIDGFTDDPAEASAEEGTELLEGIVAGVAAALVEFHRTTDAA